jgi:RHS repeat-associated protein
MLKNPTIQLLLLSLFICTFGLTNSFASGGARYRMGTVAAKGIILSENGNPIWVEYGKNGDIVSYIGEAVGNYADAAVIPASVYRSYRAVFTAIESQYSAHRTVLYKEEYQAPARIFTDASGQAIVKPQLNPTTRSVVVRNPDVLYSSDELILLESPLDLKNLTPIPDEANSLLLSKDGRMLNSASGNIGYRAAFYTPSGTDTAAGNVALGDAGTMGLDDYNRFEDKIWGPVAGVRVESTLGRTPALTDEKGFYNLTYYIPPCPGFNTSYYPYISAQLFYQTFSPNADNLKTYYVERPDWDMCTGLGEISYGYGEIADGVQTIIAYNDIVAELQSEIHNRLNINIDVAMLTGQAEMWNPGGSEILPQGDDTEYRYETFDLTPVVPETDLNGDGRPDYSELQPDGKTIHIWFADSDPAVDPPDLERLADYPADYSHQGLLNKISNGDLLDSDTYVYRVSNGQLFSARDGLQGDEADKDYNAGGTRGAPSAAIYYSQLIRGPSSLVYTQDAFHGRLEDWQAKTGVNPALAGRQVDHLRPGEDLEVVMVNRATGYIGSGVGTFGESTQSGLISFSPPKIIMQPPNLKIRVERTRITQAGLTAGDENVHLIGFEGSGLTSDKVITITTEWYQRDGSPLPDDLPGYTGRLAKVVAPNKLGQASSQIANFSIKPGRHIQVVQLPQKDIDRAHFYVHVSGEPSGGKPDFSTLGAGQGALQFRPKHYVPFKVPLYDDPSTELAKLVRREAIDNGADPATIPGVQPTYQWVYRPEMQFSVFDLKFQGESEPQDISVNSDIPVLQNNQGADLQLIPLDSNFLYTLLEDDLSSLDRFGSDRELVFAIDEHEVHATLGEDQQLVFSNPEYLAQLNPEDILALSLYQKSDEANILWEYDLNGRIDSVYVQDQESFQSLPAGEQIKLMANTTPADLQVVFRQVARSSNSVRATVDPETSIIIADDKTENGFIIVEAQVVNRPWLKKRIMIDIGCASCAAANGQCDLPGQGVIKLSSVNARFTLGKTLGGGSAGVLYLLSKEPSASLATPEALALSSLAMEGVTEIRDDNGYLRQVRAGESFVDIVTNSEYSYDLNFYSGSDIPSVMEDGGYLVSSAAQPIVSWRVENPLASDTDFNRLRLTEMRGGQNKITEYEWLPASQTWRLIRDGGRVVESRQWSTDTDGNKVETILVTDANGHVASEERITTATFSWGEELIKKVVVADGQDQETTYSYYDNADQAGPYTKLKEERRSDGSWSRYNYDALGRIVSEETNWLDSGVRTVTHNYAPLTNADEDAPRFRTKPRTVTESINGTTVSKTFYSYEGDGIVEQRTEVVERCLDAGCTFGSANNQRTVTTYYKSNQIDPLSRRIHPSSGKLQSVLSSDGKLTSYVYETGSYSGSGGFSAGYGNDHRTVATEGTEESPDGIADKTTRQITIGNKTGQTVYTATEVYDGNGYAPIGYSINVLDSFGRVTESHSSSGIITESEYGCCSRKTKEVDGQGIATFYHYDGLGRVDYQEKEGPDDSLVTANFEYDAAGRRTAQTTFSGSLVSTSSSTYDTAGRLLESIDSLGLVTRYDYSADGLTNTVARPGNVTEISESYPDGQIKSVTGTGVVPQYYAYGVNADGSRWTRVSIGSAASPRWQKTTVDMLGRTVLTEMPGYNGPVISTRNFYNAKDQLVRTETSGKAPTVFEYDELGNQYRSGIDINGNAVLDTASLDRISETETRYVKIGNDWWQEANQYAYAEENAGTRIRTSTQRNRITGLGGGLVGESVSIDINDNETVSTTTLDRASQRQTSTVNYPDSAVNGVSVSQRGVLVSAQTKAGHTVTYEYDDFGRRIAAIDPRTGKSITHYDTAGRVDYVEDAAGNRTWFGYDPDTGRKSWEKNALDKYTRYAYNNQGQMTHIWGDATYPVGYEYDAYGQRTRIHTYRNGTGWNAETWPATAAGADATIWHYDEASGLLAGKEDASGNRVSYTYTDTNQLKTRTWARTDARLALSTTYIYNPMTAELTAIDYSDTTVDVHFSYDRLGRRQTITDAAGLRTFTYNGTLQLDHESITGLYDKTITRNYDDLGRSSGFTADADYAATYGYDPATGRFSSVAWDTGGASGSATYGYLPNSNLLQSATFSSGQVITYGYEANRNLKTKVANQFGATLISQYDYGYDAIGRRENVANSGSAFAAGGFNIYGYNDRNELTASERYLGMSLNDTSQPVADEARGYGYDNIGNRLDANGWDEAQNISMQLTYTANQLNQYDLISSSIEPDKVPTYDYDGNMTGYSDKVYTYNAENRLVGVAPQSPMAGDIKVDYTYDYMGRRVAKNIMRYDTTLNPQPETRNLFLYDGWNMIAELDDTGQPTTSYVYDLDLSQSMQGAGGIGGLLTRVDAGGDYTYSYDVNGNVAQMLDSAGNIAAHYEYDPYGNTVNSTGLMAANNPYRYSTKYFDNETGLYYYGNRYYLPELGRWLNRDPIEEQGGLNLYGFVGNGPVNAVDPYGLALYAFDGTGNNDRDIDEGNYTHVYTLHEIYKKNKHYEPGVGSNWYTVVHGGLHGLGGNRRLERAYNKFLEHYKNVADKNLIEDIDIIGFSRGAALARAFANLLKERGYKGCPVKIRFVGLFDTVGSFGIPGNRVDIGVPLDLPDIVQAAAQAVAKDEKRILFPLTRFDTSRTNFDESEFSGDHSDIGRGHGPDTNALSRAPLEYIWRKGLAAGAEFGSLPPTDKWASPSTEPHDLSWQAEWWNPLSWPMVLVPDRTR